MNTNTVLLNRFAAEGNADEVRRLIPLSAPKEDDSSALRSAVIGGHVECVALLIPVSDPKVRSSLCLQTAAEHGHTECVELLIPVSNPEAWCSFALMMAVRGGHTQCVDLLYGVSDPQAALLFCEKNQPEAFWLHAKLNELVEQKKQEQKDLLYASIDAGGCATHVRNKM